MMGLILEASGVMIFRIYAYKWGLIYLGGIFMSQYPMIVWRSGSDDDAGGDELDRSNGLDYDDIDDSHRVTDSRRVGIQRIGDGCFDAKVALVMSIACGVHLRFDPSRIRGLPKSLPLSIDLMSDLQENLKYAIQLPVSCDHQWDVNRCVVGTGELIVAGDVRKDNYRKL